MLLGELDVDVVLARLGGHVLDEARAVQVVHARHFGLGGTLDGQAQTTGARSWRHRVTVCQVEKYARIVPECSGVRFEVIRYLF